jgi:diaminopimelate decarboxylase
MHLLLTVVDKKAKDLVITDAGTNTIGWERFETDYFSVINLSRPETIEHECYILGSLKQAGGTNVKWRILTGCI